MADVLTLNGRRIQGGKVGHTNRRLGIEPWHRIQNNGPLIRICWALAGLAQNRNECASFPTGSKHQTLRLDALATHEDIGDGDTADIRHGHAVVEDFQFSVQL